MHDQNGSYRKSPQRLTWNELEFLLSRLYEFLFGSGGSFWLSPTYLSKASYTMRSNEQRHFVDVAGFSGLFNRLYTNVNLPLTVQQLLKNSAIEPRWKTRSLRDISPDVCVVQVGITAYNYNPHLHPLLSHDRARNLSKYRRLSLLEAREKAQRKFAKLLPRWLSFKLITWGLKYSVWWEIMT